MKQASAPLGGTAHKQDRRDELIKVAFEAIATSGLERLRVRAVADTVGINGATLHVYFPTKEDLILAVLQYVMARVHLPVDNLTGSPRERLDAYFSRQINLK